MQEAMSKLEENIAEINKSGINFIEESVRYGNKFQNDGDDSQHNIFGGDNEVKIQKPQIPNVPEWNKLDRLNKEKELIGIYISEHPLDDFKLEIKAYCNVNLSKFNNLNTLKNKELKVAGVVKEIQHATTKKGNPYGSITLEDYSGSYRITMFGKDYLKFKNYFTVNYLIILGGKVQHRFGNPEKELEFKVTNINLLSEIKDKMIRSLAVKVPINSISDNFIVNINELVSNNSGTKELLFLIYEPETKIWIKMFSRSHRINITEKLINELETKHKVEYKIF